MKNSKIRDNNFVAIQGWMITKLGLKGNALIVYAIIYGFSQDGRTHFTGSLQYLADWTSTTKPGVHKILRSLVNKGFIRKRQINQQREVLRVLRYATFRAERC